MWCFVDAVTCIASSSCREIQMVSSTFVHAREF